MSRLTYKNKFLGWELTLLFYIGAAVIIFLIPILYHGKAEAIFPDEQTLLASYPAANTCSLFRGGLTSQQSYVCSAYILKGVGADKSNGAILGATFSLLLTFIPILRFRALPLGVFLIICAWGVIRATFLSVLSKDLLSAFTVTVSIIISNERFFNWVWPISSIIYGWVVRKYWIISSLLWISLRLVWRWITPFRFFLMLFIFYFLLATFFKAVLGQSLEFARDMVNEDRNVGAQGAVTVINPIFTSSNIFVEAMDAIIGFFRLVFPLEILKQINFPKIMFALFTPVTLWWCFKLSMERENKNNNIELGVRSVALAPLAFLIVEAIFEPDFGSFARHFSMVSPLIFQALAINNRAVFTPSIDALS